MLGKEAGKGAGVCVTEDLENQARKFAIIVSKGVPLRSCHQRVE